MEDFLKETFMSNTKAGTQIKFLHCGDIHLDTPISGIPEDKIIERKRELRATFLRMMGYIRDREIDYVLISGDLFDNEYVTNSVAELLIREFGSCPDTKFIIAPGRHDCYNGNSVYSSGRLPENCYVFNSETLSRFDFDEDKVTIYGWAFTEKNYPVNPLLEKRVDDVSKINIVCGYADLDGEGNFDTCPVSTEDLKRFGADYYAFGSRHAGTEFMNLEASMYAYAGSLECMGFSEPGIGGTKFISVRYNSGELSIDAKHMLFGHLEFKTETIDITGVDTANEIIARISQLIGERGYNYETALRIILEGYIDPRFSVSKNLDSEAFGLYHFEIVDKTLPLFGTEALKRDMSVKGEVFRTILPYMESENEEERLVAAQAFREALAALENREIEA